MARPGQADQVCIENLFCQSQLSADPDDSCTKTECASRHGDDIHSGRSLEREGTQGNPRVRFQAGEVDIRGLPERVLQLQTTWLTILEADVYVGKAGIALQRCGSDPLQSIPCILLNQTEGVFQIASTKQDRSRRSADGLVHTTLGDLGQIGSY